jgi:hypothetical protein
MYHTGKNPLKRIQRTGENVSVAKTGRQRHLHKAFLRYHDSDNWPMLREALNSMGRSDLIGTGKHQLIPSYQPKKSVRGKTSGGGTRSNTDRGLRKNSKQAAGRKQLLTQHTGLPQRKQR